MLRLPDGPKKLKPLKRSMRKNMDCLVEYLRANPRPSKPGSLSPVKPIPIFSNSSPTILGKRIYEHNVAKSKPMTQWDIMVKRMHDASRLSMSLQDKVHELD